MGKYNKNNKRLRVADFQHPADKRAIDLVTAIPGFEKLVEFISKNSLERSIALTNNSSYLKVSPEMSPKLHEMIREAKEMYGIDKTPDIFLYREYAYAMMMGGIDNVHIFLPTTWLEVVEDDMLFAVLSAQVASIQAKKEIMFFLIKMYMDARALVPPGIDSALLLALRDWERNRIYTDDRAVLLASESFELAAKHILFGAPIDALNKLDLAKPGNPYYQQAKEFLKQSGVSGVYQKGKTIQSASQWTASRYMELYNWYFSGEYHDVLERSIPDEL